MMNEKEKQLLAELMQYGYDRNIVARIKLDCDPALEELLQELNEQVFCSTWDYYDNTTEEFDNNFKHSTVVRFCFTAGLGAAWLWEKRRDDVLAKGLYQCMIEPRTDFEMDEYIEDITGIWWSADSSEHNRILPMITECIDIISTHYNINSRIEEMSACYAMVYFGVYYGETRIYRETKPYKGEMMHHSDVWNAIYRGEDEEEREGEDMSVWIERSFHDDNMGRIYEVELKKPDSEFEKNRSFYCPFTLNQDAGIRSIVNLKKSEAVCISATPVFCSYKNNCIIIDEIYVWENGVEATIEGHFVEDEDFRITFYDTHYLENRELYFRGETYVFDIYGVVYSARRVPLEKQVITLKGEEAISFNSKLNNPIRYDENGEPEPVLLHLNRLHTLLQVDKAIPEDAKFCSPIKECEVVEFLDKTLYKIDIGIPGSDNQTDDNRRSISIFLSAERNREFSTPPVKDELIEGVIYLQGRMMNRVNLDETPSTTLHTFNATNRSDHSPIFVHQCKEEEMGQPLSNEEALDFAKSIYRQQLSVGCYVKENSSNQSIPDFYVQRNRDIWIKVDTNYNAAEEAIQEDKMPYLLRHYQFHRSQIIAYISFYNIDGEKCPLLKGGRYTVKISYLSVTPDQKMDIVKHQTHETLVNILYETFLKLNTRILERYLHKDLDYRSDNMKDPMITKSEFLERTNTVCQANRVAKEGPLKPVLVCDDDNNLYIELHYPNGALSIVHTDSHNGYITAIRVENQEDATKNVE